MIQKKIYQTLFSLSVNLLFSLLQLCVLILTSHSLGIRGETSSECYKYITNSDFQDLQLTDSDNPVMTTSILGLLSTGPTPSSYDRVDI